MGTRPDTIVAIVEPGTGLPDMTVGVIGDNVVDLTGATAGQVITVQPDGSLAAEDISDLDAMRFKGVINASTNPNYPAATAGDLYRISVAGKIGGGSGPNVEVGDLVFAIADNGGGTQAAVGASWSIEQANIDGAVIGPSSVTDDLPAIFDGTTGKLIKQKTYAAFKTLLALVKGDVGLGNVDNTSDANKPVSTAQQTALNLKADLASPALTGNPTAPTASPGDNDTTIATTAFVTAAAAEKIVDSIADADTSHAPSRNAVFDALALKADLASPALTGNPTAPTASPGDNDTSIATTAFVTAADAVGDAAAAVLGRAESGINTQTADYTLVAGDAGALILMNKATAINLSIPTDANVNFPIGTRIDVIQIGAGSCTIKAVTSGTTTVLSAGATAAQPATRAQYCGATLVKDAANHWYVVGDIL